MQFAQPFLFAWFGYVLCLPTKCTRRQHKHFWHGSFTGELNKIKIYMKIIFPLLTAGILLIASCDNKKTEASEKETVAVSDVPVTTVAKTAEAEGKKTVLTVDEVPDSVVQSFNTKYPSIKPIEWVKYEPIESDDMKMDDEYYYVRYNNDGADYMSWYNNQGEWVKTSTKIPGNSKLPDAVNKTINAQYPNYTIVEIDKENDKNMEMYEVELKNGEEKAKLKILADGTIYKRKN